MLLPLLLLCATVACPAAARCCTKESALGAPKRARWLKLKRRGGVPQVPLLLLVRLLAVLLDMIAAVLDAVAAVVFLRPLDD